METPKIFESEYRFCLLLWEHEPVNSTRLVAIFKEELGWYPETPFEKGIVLTIDWYLENQEWMDHVTSGNYQKYYEEMYKNK